PAEVTGKVLEGHCPRTRRQLRPPPPPVRPGHRSRAGGAEGGRAAKRHKKRERTLIDGLMTRSYSLWLLCLFAAIRVSAMPHATFDTPTLLDTLLAEQERCWRNGERVPAENFVQRYA